MSRPAYKCSIRRSGLPTSTVSEPFTNTSGSIFQVTSDAKRVLDPTAAWNLSDGAGTISFSSIATMDFLYGEVTVPGVSGTLRFTGTYLPLGTDATTVVGEAKEFTLNESSDVLDNSSFACTTGFRRRLYGLADAELSFDLYVNATDLPRLATLHSNASLCVIQIATGFSPVFRGIGRIDSLERSGSVDGLVEASIAWKLAAQRDSATGFIVGYSERSINT